MAVHCIPLALHSAVRLPLWYEQGRALPGFRERAIAKEEFAYLLRTT